MKILLASLAVAGLALSSTAALAQDVAATPVDGFSNIDTDRNGLVSWAEFSLVIPDVNEEQFKVADIDGDGSLSADEFDNLALSTGSISPRAPADTLGVTPPSLQDTTTE